MTSIKPFQATDIFELNPINLDPLTENFQPAFYLQYLTEWPSLFFKSTEITAPAAAPTDVCSGYMMGKTEGSGINWHTHITAVTVNSHYRRLGLASYLCLYLQESTSVEPHNAYFVDLFVRVTNKLAINLYEKLGYSIYRRVVGYYGSSYPSDRNKLDDASDGFDMRLSLPRDVKKETVRENGHKVYVLPDEVKF
ncbi:hypothetical protein BABINDRAFT_161614 [Babjeviella inositovora NRRL Y-12698]|uniref:N-acetyltransferase domain-containing protein n=1 Tax=Babjeviella inositovora NRRL Y-12698 TaxID=984486 RepID=A0A1E3QSF6_9ASCO|nr:uncharacterized protein BABINDRAFT_161614 [Babjeviella inositovora NRRL Y-12698]ODQ79952.1 hypothetical protein BABINDRAFT_161614 [Babjeviella inositovora NRRL Y-12698]